MPWWPKRGGQAGDGASSASGGDVDLRVELPAQRAPEPAETLVAAVDMARLGAALDRLEIRYLTDGDGSLLAMWERHAVLFTLEGPDDEILVIRARPHGTVPPDWADRAYRVVNEWNHSRRFWRLVEAACPGLKRWLHGRVACYHARIPTFSARSALRLPPSPVAGFGGPGKPDAPLMRAPHVHG